MWLLPYIGGIAYADTNALSFVGAAEGFGVANDEDVQNLVDEIRYGAEQVVMKVMADTNIIISALLFPVSLPAKVLLHIGTVNKGTVRSCLNFSI